MIHYHGCPITPRSEMHTLSGRFFCHTFDDPRDVKLGHQIGQGNMLDNGAFTAWTQGKIPDWQAWAAWASTWLVYHNTWAVLPDVIDGTEQENDALASEWAWILSGVGVVVPVWHLHESFARLHRLVDSFGRVCFGSSGQFRTVGSPAWHGRVTDAFDRLSDEFGRVPWVHMLRGMSLAGSHYPFASVDSTDVARNHHQPWHTTRKMVERWDSLQCPPTWTRVEQMSLT